MPSSLRVKGNANKKCLFDIVTSLSTKIRREQDKLFELKPGLQRA